MRFKSRKFRDTDTTMNPGPHSTVMDSVSEMGDMEGWEVEVKSVVAVVWVLEVDDGVEEDVVDGVLINSLVLLTDGSAVDELTITLVSGVTEFIDTDDDKEDVVVLSVIGVDVDMDVVVF